MTSGREACLLQLFLQPVNSKTYKPYMHSCAIYILSLQLLLKGSHHELQPRFPYVVTGHGPLFGNKLETALNYPKDTCVHTLCPLEMVPWQAWYCNPHKPPHNSGSRSVFHSLIRLILRYKRVKSYPKPYRA